MLMASQMVPPHTMSLDDVRYLDYCIEYQSDWNSDAYALTMMGSALIEISRFIRFGAVSYLVYHNNVLVARFDV